MTQHSFPSRFVEGSQQAQSRLAAAARLSGTLKWFSSTKGFGFIAQPGQPDVFVHISAMQRANVPTDVPNGTPLSFELQTGPTGRQCAINLLVMTKQEGVVKWYRADKGFGFIVPEAGGADVFLHASAFDQAGLDSKGEYKERRVAYALSPGKNSGQFQAVDIELL